MKLLYITNVQKLQKQKLNSLTLIFVQMMWIDGTRQHYQILNAPVR